MSAVMHIVTRLRISSIVVINDIGMLLRGS